MKCQIHLPPASREKLIMVIINFVAAPLHVISPRGEFRYFNPDWGFSNQRLVISGKVVWKSYTS